ncbi:MAG: hypothetical protein B7Y40_07500 [Gammaproteobacteria bacterium 28-57-27]|nr:MAG: hypothetical protein B7Y40_07500 [Gammaproteobacteria bacterium 28-57-27]
MFKHSTQSTLSIVLALGFIGLGGCGGGSGTDSTTTADTTTTPVPATPVANNSCPSTVIPLTQAEVDEILFMREEEKLARDVYADLATYWQAQAGTVPVVTIMSNIVKAEQSHMDSVKGVLECYGLPDPVGANEPSGIFLNQELAQLYTTLMTRGKTSQNEALKVGGLIEEVDIEDLQRSIEISQQAYTDQVYAALMCGSRNHLRGFAGQLIKTQGKYTAQLLPQATVDAILATENETCGGASSAGSDKQNGKS